MAHCRPDAPLVCMEKWKKNNTSGAPCFWCAISVFHTNGASPTGAPLVYSSGALLPWSAISINPIYSPFPSSAHSLLLGFGKSPQRLLDWLEPLYYVEAVFGQ